MLAEPIWSESRPVKWGKIHMTELQDAQVWSLVAFCSLEASKERGLQREK